MTDLPPAWESIPLGNICLPVSKVDPTSLGREMFQYIDIGSVDGESNRIASTTMLVGSAPSRARQLVETGDTVISTVRPYLKKIAQIPDALNGEIASTGFCVVRPGPEIDQKFVYYWTLTDSFLRELLPKQRGASYPAVRDADVFEISIPLPPLAEQKRIVAALEDHLSRLDAGLRSLKEGGQRIRTFKKASAAHAVQGLVATRLIDEGDGKELLDKVLARRSQLVRRRRAMPIHSAHGPALEIPAHWSMASMDQLCWDIEYGTSAKAHAEGVDGDIPVLRMGNIQDGAIVWDGLKYLPHGHPDTSTLSLTDGDLLFNRTNSAELVGKSAIYRASMGAATFASYLIRCRLVNGVEPDWVNLVINSFYGRAYVRSVVSQQVGQANVNGTKLAAMPIPLPPHGEQLRILAAVAEQNAGVNRLNNALNEASMRADHLRRSLLTEAFAGRLVPQDPGDESASVLLKRIKAERAAAVPTAPRRGSRTGSKTGRTRGGSHTESMNIREQETLL